MSDWADEALHVGDIGTDIIVSVYDYDVLMDISAATSMTIILQPPGGAAKKEKTAAFYTDGTDGKMKYTTVTGDIDASGVWKIQAKVITPTAQLSTTVEELIVLKNL